jgi:WD40 repeat protein
VLKGCPDSVTSAVFSSDGKHMLLASKEGTVRVSAMDDRCGHVVVKGHGEPLQTAIFSPDDTRVLTVSGDGAVRLWNADGRGDPTVLKGKGNERVIFSPPDGKRVLFDFFFFFGDSQVLATDGVGEPVMLKSLQGDWHAGNFSTVQSRVFSPDGERIVSAYDDGTARIWNADGREMITLKSRTGNRLLDVIFSPNGKRVRTVSADGTVRVWDADSGGKLVAVKGHGATIREAVFSPDGEGLLTDSADGIARIWPQLPLTWSALLRYLRTRTTICLTVAERIRYLAEKHDAAESAFKACEQQFGR